MFDAEGGIAKDGEGLEVAMAGRREAYMLLDVAHIAREGDEELGQGAEFDFPLIEQGVGGGEAAVIALMTARYSRSSVCKISCSHVSSWMS